ncbi:MAG: extensin family protein [Paracoccaceae bacterium]
MRMIFGLTFMIILAACIGRSSYSPSPGLVQLCNDSRIYGERVGAVEDNGACGIGRAVRIREIAGVALNPGATLNCRTAKVLADWVETDARAALRGMNGRLESMRVFASYACRPRNSQRGARMSEHALGNAIDIGEFVLNNGTTLNVAQDWGRGRAGAALTRLHASACGPFGTVLGPESDRFHFNHFHFDTAEYRSGSYCR